MALKQLMLSRPERERRVPYVGYINPDEVAAIKPGEPWGCPEGWQYSLIILKNGAQLESDETPSKIAAMLDGSEG